MKQYILFDLDGTLTDPALGITNSIMHAIKKIKSSDTKVAPDEIPHGLLIR